MRPYRCNLGFATNLSPVNAFYPDATLNKPSAIWDAQRFSFIDIGATMLASGTAPPVVTVTGTPSVAPAIRVEVLAGATTFQWTRLNTGTGGTFSGSSGGTAIAIPIGGTYLMPNTGLTLHFPAGAYSSTNVYQATVSNWRSQLAVWLPGPVLSNVFSQPTAAKQPRYIYDAATGFYLLKGDGVDDSMACATIDRPAPSVTPSWFYGLARVTTRTQFDTIFSDSNPLATHISFSTSTGASGEITGSNGAPLTVTASEAKTGGLMKQFEVGFRGSAAGRSGTDPTVWGDYAQFGSHFTTAATGMGTTDPAAGLSLFSRADAASTFFNGEIPLFALYDAYPIKSDRDLLQQFASDYWDPSVIL